MAKTSRKGATSSHTIKAKGGCLQHNRRTQMSANVDPSRTHLNTSWEHDRIRNLASTRSLIRRAEKLYTEKTGQKCQASFAPLKESCVVVKDSSTLEEARHFASLVEQATGIRCLGIWFHKDEGHSRSKFRPDEPYQCNNHIHYLWDCQNPETGKAIPLKRSDMSLMQDLAAKAFSMERGIPASVSHLEHLPAAEYKLQEVLKENEKLREQNQELEELEKDISQKVDAKVREKEVLDKQTGIVAKVAAAFNVGPEADIRKENERLKAEKEAAEAARKAVITKANQIITQEREKATAAINQAKNDLSKANNLNAKLKAELMELQNQLKPHKPMQDILVGDTITFKEHEEYKDEWVATWRGYTVASARIKKDGSVDITEWHPDQESHSYDHASNLNEAWRRIYNYAWGDFEPEWRELYGQGRGRGM